MTFHKDDIIEATRTVWARGSYPWTEIKTGSSFMVVRDRRIGGFGWKVCLKSLNRGDYGTLYGCDRPQDFRLVQPAAVTEAIRRANRSEPVWHKKIKQYLGLGY